MYKDIYVMIMSDEANTKFKALSNSDLDRMRNTVSGYCRSNPANINIIHGIILIILEYYLMDTFDPNQTHKDLQISNNGSTATRIKKSDMRIGYGNIYGSIGIDSKSQKIYK